MFDAKEVIFSQIKPALGCTEPAAIALNAAYLKELIDKIPINLTINTNLLKNAMYVPIPNTDGRFGVKFAFALGFLCGNKDKGLNIFEDLDEECVKRALEFEKNINLNIVEGSGIYIKSSVEGYEVITKDYHDFIAEIKTPQDLKKFEKETESGNIAEIEDWIKKQPFSKIYEMINDDFSFLKDKIELNIKLANYGIENNCGLSAGKSLIKDDTFSRVVAFATAGADARMEGVSLPALSLTGSGNHGIAATVPVWIYAKEKGINENEALKAMGLSMLTTIYVKQFIGRLSPICGAAFASGCGSAAGLTYLMGGDLNKIIKAIKFVIETLMGVVCEGAKLGCALKVKLAAENAYQAALFAMEDKKMYEDGILEKELLKTLKNVEKVKNAMQKVDSTIVEIMESKI
ncbi:L-cysteine desulfidase family protein [Caminibacter sp.]